MLVLASRSPRRQELLGCLGLSFLVRPATVDERLSSGCSAEEEAVRLAVAKARQGPQASSAWVVGADTLVVLGDTILGKPAGPHEALRMLRNLRGREHRVVTGVAVAHKDGLWTDRSTTQVFMRSYTQREMRAFVATGAPLDKAGAYAIQDADFRPVDRLIGCYCNVVGLSLGLLLKLLVRASYTEGQAPRPPQCAGCPEWEL